MRLLPRMVLSVLLLSGRLFAAETLAPLQRLAVISIEDSMMERAEKIIIPQLEFTDLTPAEALDLLRKKILERDPSGSVKFENRYEPVEAGAPGGQLPVIPGLGDVSPTDADPPSITLSVNDIPASEALQYIAGLGGIEIEVIRGAAFLAKLKTRTFRFVFNEPALCEELGIDAKAAAKIRGDVKQYLEEVTGVTFHPGTACQVFAGGKSLFVKHTEEDIDAVQRELERWLPFSVPGPEVPKFKVTEASEPSPLQRRAERIIIGEVRLIDMPLEEATRRLGELGSMWDVNKPPETIGGIGVVVRDESFRTSQEEPSATLPLSERKVNYTAKQVSLWEAAQALAKQAGGEFVIGESALEIRSEPVLIMRTYLAPPEGSFIDKVRQKPEGPRNEDAQEFLAASGVAFPPGSSAIYLPSSSRLIARDTKAKLKRIESIVEEAWRDYYASGQWIQEQKRQQRLRELGLYRESSMELDK